MSHVTLPEIFFPGQQGPLDESTPQLPVGEDQAAVITGSAFVKNKNNAAAGALVFNLAILDGENKGAVGSLRLNLYYGPNATENENKAMRIAAQQLARICMVTGNGQQAHNMQLLADKPFRITVTKQTKGEGAEKGYTEVTGISDINKNKPWAGGQATAQSAPASATAPTQPAQQSLPTGGSPAPETAPAGGVEKMPWET